MNNQAGNNLMIEKQGEGDQLTLVLEGKLDTITAPRLEEEVKALPTTVKKLVLDFDRLDYVSSAGLRVILAFQKVMNKQGEMVIKNVSEEILEVFTVTGFEDILTIE